MPEILYTSNDLLDILVKRVEEWTDDMVFCAQPMAENKNRFLKTIRKVAIFPFVVLVRFYQICISPLKPPTCRFTPTCSQYALEAFRKHGPFKGLYLTIRRLLRCHPWGGHGYDPVP